MLDMHKHFPIEVDAAGNGPATGETFDHAECACTPGTAPWPCPAALRDMIAAWPGISTRKLVREVRRRVDPSANRHEVVALAHASGLTHGFGQLTDGTWWTTNDSAEIATRSRDNLPGPPTSAHELRHETGPQATRANWSPLLRRDQWTVIILLSPMALWVALSSGPWVVTTVINLLGTAVGT